MADKDKIYGMLSTISVELPPENEEKKREAEKMNKEISCLGIRVFRAATDYGFVRYEDTATYRLKGVTERKRVPRIEPTRFETGDLVTIFKSVSDGDVHWHGTVNLDRSDYHHGYQTGMSKPEWSRMFYDELPATLERGGKVIYGALDPFCETGTEGVIWAVHEYGVSSYAGLHTLKDGDELTVYGKVRDGDVEWQGRLDFGPEHVSKLNNWAEILREPRHMDPQEWLQMCYQSRPIIVTPK